MAALIRIKCVTLFTLLLLCNYAQAQDTCLNFDGNRDFVLLPTLNWTDSTEITIEAWVNPDSIKVNRFYHILRQNGSTLPSPQVAWLFAFQDYGRHLSFGLNTKRGWKELDYRINAADFEGKWNHVAATYNGSHMVIFVNGVAMDSTAHTGLLNVTGNTSGHRLGIGGGREEFNGRIDELRFWLRARKAGQIASTMRCQVKDTLPHLWAVYNLDEGQGSYIHDELGNMPRAQLRNGTKWDKSWVDTNCCKRLTGKIDTSFCDTFYSPSGRYKWTASGKYTDTVPSYYGCDSILTIHLTRYLSDSSNIQVSSCGSYTGPSNKYTWTQTGIYRDTILSTQGCDSVIIISLTINSKARDTIYPVRCDSFVSPSFRQTWYQSGVYSDTLVSYKGCDSIIAIYLTIGHNTIDTMVQVACDSFTSPSLRYRWTASGTYNDTLKSRLGCDSVLVFNLSIVHPTYDTISISTCDSLISPSKKYTWASSGTYQDTLLASNGCDSILTIQLTINTASIGTYLVDTCSAITSPSGKYYWQTSGVYNDTLINYKGCDSVVIATVIISKNYDSISVKSCGPYLSPSGKYQWSKAGIYRDTLSSVKGCDSVVWINLNMLTTYDTIKASKCYSYTSPSGRYMWTQTGKYYDTLTNASGCDSVVYIDLTIHKDQNRTIRVSACKSYTSPSGTSVWTKTGLYSDVLPSYHGCDSNITVSLTIVGDDSIRFSFSGCGSFTSPSGKYEWTKTGVYRDTLKGYLGCDSIVIVDLAINESQSFFSDTLCKAFVSPTGKVWDTSGVFKDTIPNTRGCDSVMTFALHISRPTNTEIDTTVCDTFVSPSGKFKWTQSGVYVDSLLSGNGCDSVVTIKLKVATGDTINPIACSAYTSPSGKYTWAASGTYHDTLQNAFGCDSVVVVNLTISGATFDTLSMASCIPFSSPISTKVWRESGTYFDTIPSWRGCDSILVFQLKIEPLRLDLGDDLIACEGDVLKLSYEHESGDSIWWSDGSNTPSLEIAEPGVYWLNIKRDSCPASDTLQALFVNDDTCHCQFFIPNSFSPTRKDGINDVFVPTYTCNFTDFSIMIFDRWGSLVFRSDDPQASWDGIKKDKHLAIGVYFYIIRGTTDDGEEHQIDGNITIMR